jgi:hypothetical protein
MNLKNLIATAVAGALAIGASSAFAGTVSYDFTSVIGQYTGQSTPLVVNGATFSSPSDAASNALGLGQPGTYYASANNLYSSALGSSILSTAGYGSLVPDSTLTINFNGASQDGIAFAFALGTSSGGEQLVVTTNAGTTTTLTSFTTDAAGYPEGLFSLTSVPNFTSVTITATDSLGAQDLAIGSLTTTPVPLPGTLPLLLSGIAGAGLFARRRRGVTPA